MNYRVTKPSIITFCSVLALAAATPSLSDECRLDDGTLKPDCRDANAGAVVEMPVGANTELATNVPAASAGGFAISVDGETVVGDREIADESRRIDVQLSRADVQVKFDGLHAKPRLDLEISGAGEVPGSQVTVQSRLNYPAFVERGEIRIVDWSVAGGRTIMTVPIDPNGKASFTMPEGEELVVTHRVYDARGRFDETGPLSLNRKDTRPLSDQEGTEEGSSTLERRTIPVHGGAVTVFGSGVQPGASVRTLGATIVPDENGKFVVERILPAGDHAVDVDVSGAGEDFQLTRDVTIPRSEWFYVATADLTWGKRFPDGAPSYTYDKGRIAFYAKGKTALGWTITSSVDTKEVPLDELFSEFDKRDPRSLLLRLDDNRAYPTYGDDSSIAEDAPTSGKFYIKAERNGNHVMWGNFRSTIAGSTYLRNERTLYGLQGVYNSQAQTSHGEARVSVEAFASQPDNVTGRDVFRGTGGTVYFLQEQDISIGSETITVEIRDGDTNRVIERRTLQYGRDYTINYIQGVVVLTDPLAGATGVGTVVTNPGGEYVVNLVAQYEYTPAAGSLDGYSFGGRVEAWVTDQVRLGFTGMNDETGTADQKSWGVDLHLRYSENTYLDLEYAESTGPGFGWSYSQDGGLIIDNTPGAAGTGEAYLIRGQADLRELGLAADGTMSAYWEKRSAGFSTLDYNVGTDEELWGVALDMAANDRLRFKLYYDDYANAAGNHVREGGAELELTASERVKWNLGVEYVDKATPGSPTQTGARTDVAAKVTITPNPNATWYVFGQKTVDRSGGLVKNDRYGAGTKLRFNDAWTLEAEISDGTLGLAGRALVSYEQGAHNSSYFGYELDPDRTMAGVTLQGRDKGRFIAGGKRRLGDRVDLFAENTFDAFGIHRSLTSRYGVEYQHTERLRYTFSYEMGRIDDPAGDFDRNAFSLGAVYSDGDRLDARVRLEYRKDRGVLSGTVRDSDTYAVSAQARYKISDSQRLLFSFQATDSQTSASPTLSGDYVDATLGYAYRPVDNDRLNLLLKYRYLYDMYGQVVDGTDTPGPVQESHVFTLDASYDLNEQWTLGGKVGFRLSESAPDSTTPLSQNDAWLGVLNLRYHVTHKWDVLLEARHFEAHQAGLKETSFLGAAYRHVGNNVKLGVGYNFGSFSDDLTDLTYDDKGVFINVIAKF